MPRASTFPVAHSIPPPSLLESQNTGSVLQDIVETYMASHRSRLDGSIHRALNTNDPRIQRDTKKHKWVETKVEDVPLEELYRNVEEDEREFLDAVKIYEKQVEEKYRVGVSMKKIHTLEDVMREIDEAQKNYDEKDRIGAFAPIRKAFRKLGANIEACNDWLEIMPRGSQDFFSIICGGCRLILGAAGRLHRINDVIIDALIQIPTLISKSRRIRAINRTVSPKLRDYCSALYVAVLRAMGHIIEFYHHKAIKKVLSVFAKPEPLQKTLVGVINAMKQSSVAIDEEAAFLSMETNKETNQVVKKTKEIAEDVLEIVGSVEEQADEICQKTDQLNTLVRSMSQESYRNYKQTQVIIDALTHISVHFMANSLQEPGTFDQRDSLSQSTSPQGSASLLEAFGVRKKLISRLSDKETPKLDMRANLKSGFDSTLEDQESALFVMKSSHLKNWLRSAESSILFVHGGSHKSGGHRSPLSFVCAKLANSLKETGGKPGPGNKIIDLHFFCGEHVDWRDNHVENGPAGVLNSLLAQLLAQYRDFDLSLIKHLKNLKADKIEALGKVFSKLIAQLPDETIVFCIIDGLAFYDDMERGEECEHLVTRLIALAKPETRRFCVFKLLVTNTMVLRVGAIEDLNEEEVLTIPERVERGGGFTEWQWEAAAGKDVAELRSAQGS